MSNTKSPLFPLGQITASAAARTACPSQPYIELCLSRHQCGDWGHVSKADAARNAEALRSGGPLVSAYPIDPARPCEAFGANCLCVVTVPDRSMTALMLATER